MLKRTRKRREEEGARVSVVDQRSETLGDPTLPGTSYPSSCVAPRWIRWARRAGRRWSDEDGGGASECNVRGLERVSERAENESAEGANPVRMQWWAGCPPHSSRRERRLDCAFSSVDRARGRSLDVSACEGGANRPLLDEPTASPRPTKSPSFSSLHSSAASFRPWALSRPLLLRMASKKITVGNRTVALEDLVAIAAQFAEVSLDLAIVEKVRCSPRAAPLRGAGLVGPIHRSSPFPPFAAPAPLGPGVVISDGARPGSGGLAAGGRALRGGGARGARRAPPRLAPRVWRHPPPTPRPPRPRVPRPVSCRPDTLFGSMRVRRRGSGALAREQGAFAGVERRRPLARGR